MVCSIVFPIPTPPPLTFYERMLNYFPAWMEVDFGNDVTIVEDIVYTENETFTELTNSPVTNINEVRMIGGGTGEVPFQELHLFTTGDLRTDIDNPDINNVSSVKGFISGQFSTFIESHDYTFDSTGVVWTVGGNSPDTGTNVTINYIADITNYVFVNGTDYVLFNNHVHWFDSDRRPTAGDTIRVTYYQLVSNKIITALLSSFSEEFEEYVCNAAEVQEAHWIDTMEGQELDFTGVMFQTPRITGETDEIYRSRLKGLIQNFVGGGTVQAIKNAVNLLTGNDPEVHDGQFTNPEGFTTTDTRVQVTLYRQTETYVKIDESTPVLTINSISGTLSGSPHVFVNGTDYDLFSESNVRWRKKAGLNEFADIPDNLTNITIDYDVEIPDFRAATMRIDISATDFATVPFTSIVNAIEDAKAAGVLYILNVDLTFSDTISIAEAVFTDSPDLEGPNFTEDFTIGEDDNYGVALSIGGIKDDWLIWDIGNWDEKDWPANIEEVEIVSVNENFSITIN